MGQFSLDLCSFCSDGREISKFLIGLSRLPHLNVELCPNSAILAFFAAKEGLAAHLPKELVSLILHNLFASYQISEATVGNSNSPWTVRLVTSSSLQLGTFQRKVWNVFQDANAFLTFFHLPGLLLEDYLDDVTTLHIDVARCRWFQYASHGTILTGYQEWLRIEESELQRCRPDFTSQGNIHEDLALHIKTELLGHFDGTVQDGTEKRFGVHLDLADSAALNEVWKGVTQLLFTTLLMSD